MEKELTLKNQLLNYIEKYRHDESMTSHRIVNNILTLVHSDNMAKELTPEAFLKKHIYFDGNSIDMPIQSNISPGMLIEWLKEYAQAKAKEQLLGFFEWYCSYKNNTHENSEEEIIKEWQNLKTTSYCTCENMKAGKDIVKPGTIHVECGKEIKIIF